MSVEWEKGKLDIVHSLFCRSADPLYGNSGAPDVRYLYSLIFAMPLLIHAGLEVKGKYREELKENRA